MLFVAFGSGQMIYYIKNLADLAGWIVVPRIPSGQLSTNELVSIYIDGLYFYGNVSQLWKKYSFMYQFYLST